MFQVQPYCHHYEPPRLPNLRTTQNLHHKNCPKNNRNCIPEGKIFYILKLPVSIYFIYLFFYLLFI